MEILSGAALSERIRQICQGGGARKLAVAFWGPDIHETLFPHGTRSVEIILDVSLGGTSKRALSGLGVPSATNVWACEGLHTKLYIGAKGAIVGSANASKNALGAGLGGGRLQELGVWLDAVIDRDAYNDAVAEFERLKTLAHLAVQADVDRAPDQVARVVRWKPTTDIPATFLELVASDPDRFQDTFFIFGDAEITDEQEREGEELLERERDKGRADDSDEQIVMYLPEEVEEMRAVDAHQFIVMFYWVDGQIPKLHAFENIRRLPRGKLGNFHYVGNESWEHYCKLKALPSNLHDRTLVESQDAAAARTLRGRDRRGQRWKEYTALRLAEAMEVEPQ